MNSNAPKYSMLLVLAKKLKDEYISVEHLLLAMTEDQGATGRTLREFGVTRDRLLRTLQEVRAASELHPKTPKLLTKRLSATDGI